MKTRHPKRAILLLALAALVGPTAFAGPSPAEVELERMDDLYRAITAYHVLLQGDGVTREMVTSALYDVEQYVEELDSRLATNTLFIEDQRALEALEEIVAKAHLQAALLHAKGVDLEGSISQYEQVIDLIGHDPADWEVDVERSARSGLLRNYGEIVFETAKPRQIVEDLKSFWASGVVTRFKVEEYATSQRLALRLERIGGRTDPFSTAAFDVAAERFQARIAKGQEEFRVVLPPGHYKVAAADEGIAPLEFRLPPGGVPDPVVLNPNTFSFEFATEDPDCRPQLTHNGLPVRTFAGLPYGSFRVEAPSGCKRRLPDKIVVEQNSQVTLRTEPEKLDYVKEGQPIFLFITTPPGSTYTLRM
jgi:hypothetical protein